ncbi:Hypothetical predicted protein [Lynx pardinus]|uniref:Uncharacterized protein n=1 Tax=Lynx pardinus TaxID=191816 RepID=A0A485MK62_LYNPA|nr:Hypothetical predicted protein [Lynx pardinus]
MAGAPGPIGTPPTPTAAPCPPCARPVGWECVCRGRRGGCPHLPGLGPARARGARPRPRRRLRSPHPAARARRRAWHRASLLGARPGQGNFPARVCAGRGWDKRVFCYPHLRLPTRKPR